MPKTFSEGNASLDVVPGQGELEITLRCGDARHTARGRTLGEAVDRLLVGVTPSVYTSKVYGHLIQPVIDRALREYGP